MVCNARWMAVVPLAASALVASTSAEAAPHLVVTAATKELTADGRAATTLTVGAYIADGRPVKNGKRVKLVSTLGAVSGTGRVMGGKATFTFTAGTWPGTASFYSPDGWDVLGDAAIDLVHGQGVGTTLHLHGSVSEGDGTMIGHTVQADEQGVDLLWWNDHDFLYYPEHDQELTGYDFETGTLSYQMPFWGDLGYTDVGWEETEDTFPSGLSSVAPEAAHTGTYGWKLKGTALPGESWNTLRSVLKAWPMPTNFKSLMGDVGFRVSIRPRSAASADSEVWIDFELSKGQDEVERKIHLVHSATDYSANDTNTEVHYPIDAQPEAWALVDADLSAISRERFPDLGEDAHVIFVEVAVRARRGAEAFYDLDDFEWFQEIVGDDLRDLQRAYLASLPYDPLHLVGAEIGTDPERHINAFGSSVPLVPYSERSGWTTADLVDQVHAYGGIASYNHVFGVGLRELDALARAGLVVEAIDLLLAEDAFGCDLLEVGYRKREGLLEDFLAVWDALSMSGMVITGIGASDLHDQKEWDTNENRFLTWVESATTGEDDLMYNLARGAAWFGDPVLFLDADATASLSCDTSQAVMGQVVEGESAPQDIVFTASPLSAGWQVRLVENAAVTETLTVAADGDFTTSTTIDPVGGNVVRYEVVTSDGAPALYTNPIYFLDSVDPGAIGDERRPDP